MAKLRVTGLAEMGRKFKQLDYEVQQKIARAMTNAGAQVIKKKVAQLAPVLKDGDEYYVQDGPGGDRVKVEKGNLGRNVVVKRLKPSETDATSEHLIVMRGKRKYGFASRIGSLQEFGTVEMPAQPFFRPGANQAVEPALSAAKTRFKKRIDKAIKDLSK